MTSPSPRRLATVLFIMAFGYALLSVCLFRILAFSTSSTAFFVLYVGAGMPVGAYLAQRLRVDRAIALRFSIRALWWLILLVPLIGWLATLGVSPLLADPTASISEFDVSFFWRRLAYQFLVASPFFVVWGFGEFVGYEMAMQSGSRALRTGFYLLFVWALLAAVLIGFWAIHFWGWAHTVALAAFASIAAYDSLEAQRKGWRRRLAPYGLAALVWFVAGTVERPFVALLHPETGLDARLRGDRQASPPRRSIVASVWGSYGYVSLIQEDTPGGPVILGAYDGVVHWTVRPGMNEGYTPMASIFDSVEEGGDIAVLGAGGGRQVDFALRRKASSVVAVDVIPEVFPLFRGEYAWANDRVYQSPLVETVAADGRNYLLDSARQFDLIILPNTESIAAIVRALFEPGQRIHTVEAFTVMRRRLKPRGLLAIIKPVDANERLFNSYAAGLKQAGLNVVGWIHPTKGPSGQTFLLLASLPDVTPVLDARGREYFDAHGFRSVNFQESAPRGQPLYDDSPWILGVLGSFIPADKLRTMFLSIASVAVLGVIVMIALAGRRHDLSGGIARHAAFVLAGVGVGINAVYLQNGLIYWLLHHLFNPLAAFFVGTALFLLMWGLSSALLRNWGLLVAVSGAGIAGLLLSGSWQSYGSLASMACIAIGSGFCFPLLGLRFQVRLLDLFVADAIGGFSGGILGIWLPLSFGLGQFFRILPWVSGGTLVLVVIALLLSPDPDRSLVSRPVQIA